MDPSKQEVEMLFTNLKKYNFKETEKTLVKEINNAIDRNRNRRAHVYTNQDIYAFYLQYVQFTRTVDGCLDSHKFTLNVIRFFLVVFYYAKVAANNIKNSVEFLRLICHYQNSYFLHNLAACIADPRSDALKLNILKDRVVIFIAQSCHEWLREYFEDNPSEKLEEILDLHFVFKDNTRDYTDYLLGIYSPKDYVSSILKHTNELPILLGVPDETFLNSIQQEFSASIGLPPESPDERKKVGRKKTKKDAPPKITIPQDCPDWSRIPLPNM